MIARLYRTFSSGNLNRPLSKRMAARNLAVFLCAAVFGIMMFALAVYGRRGYGNARGIWGTGAAAVLGVFLFILAAYLAGKKNMETARDLEELAKCVGEIRDGNYKDFGGQFAGHDLENIMEQMEDIRCGMEKAVDEQMKSERMKVELIANVSHDIKTPLTSIISYVQFLKQEEGLPEYVKEYVAILDEKSQKLNNMVQDVFAVSKAASGELPMHMEELDFGKLLRQTLADMEEEIGRSPVTFRTEIPEEAVMIRADGQRMYRVFQNLFQNAIQYSLEGSRVYVSLRRDGREGEGFCGALYKGGREPHGRRQRPGAFHCPELYGGLRRGIRMGDGCGSLCGADCFSECLNAGCGLSFWTKAGLTEVAAFAMDLKQD